MCGHRNSNGFDIQVVDSIRGQDWGRQLLLCPFIDTHLLYYLVDIDVQVNYRSILNILYKMKSEVDCTDSFAFITLYYY